MMVRITMQYSSSNAKSGSFFFTFVVSSFCRNDIIGWCDLRAQLLPFVYTYYYYFIIPRFLECAENRDFFFL
jgi:hypothetical protein